MTTQQCWNNAIAKALELDGERAARYIGEGRFLVVSASDAGAYEVRLNVIDGQPAPTCTCKAAEYDQPCWHRATVLLIAGFAEVPTDESETSDKPQPVDLAAEAGALFANPNIIFEQAS